MLLLIMVILFTFSILVALTSLAPLSNYGFGSS